MKYFIKFFVSIQALYKKDVAYTRLDHVLLQGCSAWMDETQKVT